MRDFLKNILSTVIGLAIFCGISIGGLVFLLVSAALNNSGPQVKDKSMLVFDLSLNVKDAESNLSPDEALRQSVIGSRRNSNTIALRTVLESLDRASRDKRIVGLFLEGDLRSPSTGYANLKEVRQALERFRDSGKPIVAYDVDWGKKEYYLASVANTVVLNPFGTLEMNGLRAESIFLAGALEKYGVGIQVTRVGKYKSAVEPLLLKKNSPASRQQTQRLLNDLWGEIVGSLAKSRKLSPAQVQSIADNQGTLIASEALQQRLVDKVASSDQVVTDLKQLTGNTEKDKSFNQISLKSYARTFDEGDTATPKSSRGNADSDNRIAIVYAQGDIVSGEGGDDEIGSDSLVRQLRKLRRDKNVKAVVLRIDSPGGSATASDVIQQEIIALRKVKPLVASMGNTAASGGYWIATYADRIFAEPNTITGSIGVFGILPNVQKLANGQGVTWDTVKTGRYADISTVSRPKTPQELAINQKVVNWIYDQFLTKVSESRKIPKARVAQIAQGRVWSGTEAKKIGLVDEIGGLDQAIQDAVKRAKVGDDWGLDEYPRNGDFQAKLFQELTSSVASQPQVQPDALTQEFLKLQQDLQILRSLNDPRGVYARLPFLRID